MRTSHSRSGFTLVEVMAAVAIMGIGLVALILAVNRAKDTAFVTRNLKAVRNLATNLLAEIERGRFENLYDGYSGDFSSEGYPEFQYEIGIGEDSSVPTAPQDMRTEEEKRRAEADALAEESQEESASEIPAAGTIPLETVIVRVHFPSLTEEPVAYVLVKKIPKNILEGNFSSLTGTESGDANAPTK